MSNPIGFNRHPRITNEPNHRQQLALERIEFAAGELATALLSNCRSRQAAEQAIRDVRRAVAPILTEILTVD